MASSTLSSSSFNSKLMFILVKDSLSLYALKIIVLNSSKDSLVIIVIPDSSKP